MYYKDDNNMAQLLDNFFLKNILNRYQSLHINLHKTHSQHQNLSKQPKKKDYT